MTVLFDANLVRSISRPMPIFVLHVLLCACVTNVFAATQQITGFTKIVDGSTPIPGSPADTFYDDYFFPGNGTWPPATQEQTMSHDGVNTAFLGCTSNAADTNCASNEFGAYYGSGGAVVEIMHLSSSNAVPFSISIHEDEAGWLQCTIAWGCYFELRGRNIQTGIFDNPGPGVAIPIVSDPYIAYTFDSGGVYVYDTDANTTATIATAATSVPSNGQLFSSFGNPDASDSAGQLVAFFGAGTTVQGIYTNHAAGSLRRVVDTSIFLPGSTTSQWLRFEQKPVISGDYIVFQGYGSLGDSGLWRESGGTVAQIIDYAALGFSVPLGDFDVQGENVVFGTSDGGGTLYLWNDGDSIAIVSAGDLLDGKTVANVTFIRGSLGPGSLAFPVLFTDGSEAIYRADFGPTTVEAIIDVGVTPTATAIHPHHEGNLAVAGGLNDVIPVIVFGSSVANGDPVDLDASTINTVTVGFGPAGGAIIPGSGVFNVDVDFDGDDDAQFEFLTGDTGIQCLDLDATLTGSTLAGQAFEGADSIVTDCNAQCHN